MDLEKVLAQLHAELENLDAAIASLERIQQGDRRCGTPAERHSKTRGAKGREKRIDPDKRRSSHPHK
jgi:hypothetical protein